MIIFTLFAFLIIMLFFNSELLSSHVLTRKYVCPLFCAYVKRVLLLRMNNINDMLFENIVLKKMFGPMKDE
jgi:hypothetical protein